MNAGMSFVKPDLHVEEIVIVHIAVIQMSIPEKPKGLLSTVFSPLNTTIRNGKQSTGVVFLKNPMPMTLHA